MIANVELTPSSMHVTLTRHDEDEMVSGRARAGRGSFGVWAPVGLRFDDVHPDLVALSVLLVARPWTTDRLVVEGTDGVSERLAHTVRTRYGIELSGSGDVPPRRAPARGRAGLAFSGGVDSTAAMILLPDDTPLVFLNRVGPDRTASETHYQSAAAHHALERLSAMGRETYAVDTDLEHTRRPTGFPTHLANAVPAILFADSLRLHSMSWGTILEAAYGVGSSAGFRDWSQRSSTRKERDVLAAVGLPVSLVVAGLSEVATAKVVLGSRYASITQSCVRGSIEPCGQCKKCFRKGLLDRALSAPVWTAGQLEAFYRVEAVRRELTEVPLHHEDVYGYLLSGYGGEDRVLSRLRDQVQAETVDYTLFERYYPPYLDIVHVAERAHVSRAVADHLEPMSEVEQERLRGWRPVAGDRADAHQQLLDTLADYQPADPTAEPAQRPALRARFRQLFTRTRG